MDGEKNPTVKFFIFFSNQIQAIFAIPINFSTDASQTGNVIDTIVVATRADRSVMPGHANDRIACK